MREIQAAVRAANPDIDWVRLNRVVELTLVMAKKVNYR